MNDRAALTPSRLELARQRRGVTLVQLAREIGITAQSLSNAENGRQQSSVSTIEKLAAVLRFPVEFFSAPDLEELQEGQLTLRARSKTTMPVKNAARSSARIAVELKRWIDDRFVPPSVAVPSLSDHMSPELAAEHVRARWRLDPLHSVPNCVHLLESKGVAIFSLPYEFADVDAFSFWWRGTPFIMVNPLKSSERRRFDVAHELGHLVMHRNEEYGQDWRRVEREADAFAAAFLMPREGIRKHFQRQPTTDRIIRGKSHWKVPAIALAYRLHELGLLSDWPYRQVITELGRLGYRAVEPDSPAGETSLLLAKVFSALRADRVPFNSVAKDLNIDPQELRSLTFGLLVQSTGLGRGVDTDSSRVIERPQLRLVR